MLAANAILQNRYRIIRIIGQGGMGAVYQAVDQRLGCTVAIKQTFFNDDELGRAFEREARLLAKLRHPALPKVSDHFIEAGGQFLVMEFIQGDDLAKLLKREPCPFPPDQVLEWGYQLLDALDYLHRQDPPIIHRDIKPQNLKLTESQIVLLDFGLAKGAPQLVAGGGTASSLFGYTLNYAPLEQIQCAGTDSRSDLYSLGATLYHLMTAVTPPGSLSRAAAIATGEPDPLVPANEVNPLIPPAVADVVSQTMALRPDRRPSTPSEMRMALREAQHRPSAGRPVFGAISPDVVAGTGPEHRWASVKERPVVDPTEAPTRLMEQPALYAAPDTVAMATKTASSTWDIRNLRSRSLWGWYLAALILAFALLYFLMRVLPSQDTPAVAATQFPPRPALPATKAPPAPPPPPFVPSTPGAPVPGIPQLILPSDGDLKFRKGTVTIRWAPVPGATGYEVELVNNSFSKSWVETRTSKTFHTIHSREGTRFVRLTAIFYGRLGTPSRWWEIVSETPSPMNLR